MVRKAPASSTLTNSKVDPALVQLSGGTHSGHLDVQTDASRADTVHDLPLDPALFEIQNVIEDARKGKVSLTEADKREVDAVHPPASADDQHMDLGGEEWNEDIDPALREIVNSLTNAQAVSHALRQ
jgi:hypothetical protein